MQKGRGVSIRPPDPGRRRLRAGMVMVVGIVAAVLAARLLPRGEFLAGPLMPAVVVTVTILGRLPFGLFAAFATALARLALIDDPVFGVDDAGDVLPALYLLIGALLLAVVTDRLEIGRTRASTAVAHMHSLSAFEAGLAELDNLADAPARIGALAAQATGSSATLRPVDPEADDGTARPAPNVRRLRPRRGGEWVLELAAPPADRETERLIDDVVRQIGQTIERVALLEMERQARAEEDLILSTSARLSQSLDVQETIETLQSVFVPAIADSVTITLGDRPPSHDAADEGVWSVELRSRDRLIGWLTVVRADRSVDLHARALVGRLATRAAQALDNALVYDAQHRTRAILERSLLPHAILPVDHLEVATRYQPATAGADVGGDFYDAVRRSDGSIVLIIGDVQGKGVAAATLTAVARHTLRSAALEGHRPAELLGHLNQALFYGKAEQAVAHADENSERFVTACVVVLTPTPWGFEAMAACGGHPPPLVVRADTSTENLNARGPLLGLLEAPVFREQKTDLREADTIVLYTDGVTELRHGGEWFDDVGLGRLLHNRRAAVDAEAIAQLIQDTALLLSEDKPRDDIAILVASVRGARKGTPDRSEP